MLSTKTKIQLAKALFSVVSFARGLSGLKNVGVFKRRGVNWELDLSQGIDFAIFLQGAFEPETVRFYSKIIKPGDVVIDIGANIGAHTLHFAKLVGPTGRVIAFEPTDYAFSKLQRNLELNPELQKRVVAKQFLLDSGEGIKPNAIPSSWELCDNRKSQKHDVHCGTYNSLDAACVHTLDNAMESMGNPKIQLLKLDVDGYELQVLKGAHATLLRNQPDIIMEIVPYIYKEHGYNLETLLNLLTPYEFFDFQKQKVRFNKISSGASINVYATHKR
jgi:FkbM family methyltransferase